MPRLTPSTAEHIYATAPESANRLSPCAQNPPIARRYILWFTSSHARGQERATHCLMENRKSTQPPHISRGGTPWAQGVFVLRKGSELTHESQSGVPFCGIVFAGSGESVCACTSIRRFVDERGVQNAEPRSNFVRAWFVWSRTGTIRV